MPPDPLSAAEETTSRETVAAADPGASSWAFQVATALGIPIRIHVTFVLLLGYIGFLSVTRGESPFASILFILLVFTCVALHELGHAAMAQRFGVRTREIVLYPIGGVARLENIPSGWAELMIALAGPAVNLVLAIGLAFVLAATVPDRPPLAGMPTGFSGLALKLLVANGMLFLFNLIPAFPMDGGRVLRALLSLNMSQERATDIAATVGQTLAMLFAAIGIFGIPGTPIGANPLLLFIALFVFLGAGQEAAFHRQRAEVVGRSAAEAMIVDFETLAPQDSLGRAAERLLATHQQDFPVVDAWNRLVGILPRSVLLQALAREGTGAAVLEVMLREPITVPADADLEEVLRLLQSNPGQPVLVLDDGGLKGMITLENLAEFIEISRSVRRGARLPARA
jgi:Zn-dependent protease